MNDNLAMPLYIIHSHSQIIKILNDALSFKHTVQYCLFIPDSDNLAPTRSEEVLVVCQQSH